MEFKCNRIHSRDTIHKSFCTGSSITWTELDLQFMTVFHLHECLDHNTGECAEIVHNVNTYTTMY